MKNLITQVNSVLMKSADSNSEAIDHFLKGVIIGVQNLSHIGPRVALSKVVQFKNRAVKVRLEEADRFIKNYSEFIEEKELSWADLMRHWGIPKSLETNKLLKERIKKFEAAAEEIFEKLRENSERHNESLVFLLENYDVSKEELSKISSIRKKLEVISKITYEGFVRGIIG